MSFYDTIPPEIRDRSWTGDMDSAGEPAAYIHECLQCGREFFGGKGRRVCSACVAVRAVVKLANRRDTPSASVGGGDPDANEQEAGDESV